MSEMEEISDLSTYSKSLEKPLPKLTGAMRAGEEVPTDPENGMLWVNRKDSSMYVYVDTGKKGDWIQVGGTLK